MNELPSRRYILKLFPVLGLSLALRGVSLDFPDIPAKDTLPKNRTTPPVYFTEYSPAGLLSVVHGTTYLSHKNSALNLLIKHMRKKNIGESTLSADRAILFDEQHPATIKDIGHSIAAIDRGSSVYNSLCDMLGPHGDIVREQLSFIVFTNDLWQERNRQREGFNGIHSGTVAYILNTQNMTSLLGTVVHEAGHGKFDERVLAEEIAVRELQLAAREYLADRFGAVDSTRLVGSIATGRRLMEYEGTQDVYPTATPSAVALASCDVPVEALEKMLNDKDALLVSAARVALVLSTMPLRKATAWLDAHRTSLDGQPELALTYLYPKEFLTDQPPIPDKGDRIWYRFI